MSIIRNTRELPAPSTVVQKIPDGDAGAKYTLIAMRDVVRKTPCNGLIASLLRSVVASTSTDSQRIDAVYRWTTSLIRYQKDSPEMEEIKSPCRVLRDVNQHGISEGDCDDMAVFLANAFKLLGMRAGFLAVSNQRIPEGATYPKPVSRSFGWLDKVLLWFGFRPVVPVAAFHGETIDYDLEKIPLDHVMAIVFDRNQQTWVTVDPVAPGKKWDGHKWMVETV